VPFPMDAIRSQLAQTGDGILRDRGWLKESLDDPQEFSAALFKDAARRSQSPPKSQYGLAYDLYHDLVARHATGPMASRPAFLWIAQDRPGQGERGTPLRALSYAQLHVAATALCMAWKRRGVRPGELLCVIQPLGPEILITLCAALQLGLVVGVLPPLGPDFLRTRLRALQPRHIATARRYHGLLKEWYGEQPIPIADFILDEPQLPPPPRAPATGVITPEDLADSAPHTAAGSHAYGPDDLVFGVFSPQREPCWEPIPLSASALYLGALRDGLLLGLGHPGCVLAAPEHHFLQHQPTLLLLVLLHGGTYLHIDATALTREPMEALRLPGIDVLLISALVRDDLLRRPARPLREVRSWVCALTEVAQPIEWRDWVERSSLHSVPGSCWHYDAACAGALLFSLRQSGSAPVTVHPAPGRPFLLADPADERTEARGPHGILRPLPGSSGLLLVEHAGGYVYGGTRWPTRGGLTMAPAEVEALVGSLPYVAGAVLVPEPGDRGTATLLTFIGPHMRNASHTQLIQIEHRIRDRIRTRLGVEFVPSSVQILAALPRRTEQGIDFNWCRNQLRRGGLVGRAADPVLSRLDQLIFACHRATTPVGFMTLLAQRTRR
jgi:hypothetical protein